MCIAIYSPIGVDIPCEEYLKTSFENNPHGAGFAYNTKNNNVQIEKGFMTWDEFKKAIGKANRKNALKNKGVLIHFRIQTHGGINPECCHPFPLIADEAAMKKKKIKTDYAVIHNGIISLTSSEAYRRERMSDTMVFIEKYLSKIATNKKWFNNKSNFELIGDLIDSKMAILNGYGKIHSTDGFTKDEDGNWYSNTTYKTMRVKSTTTRFYNHDYDSYNYNRGYNYDYDYGYGYNNRYSEDREYAWSHDSMCNGLAGIIQSASNEREVDTLPDSEFENGNPKYEPLMKMDKEMICINYGLVGGDFEDELLEFDSALPIFIDEEGYLFQTDYESVDENTGIVTNLDCIGYGEFEYINATTNYDPTVPFKPDYKALKDDLWV